MYVTGWVIPVPEESMEAYRRWAELGAEILKDYGCIEIVEATSDTGVYIGKATEPLSLEGGKLADGFEPAPATPTK